MISAPIGHVDVDLGEDVPDLEGVQGASGLRLVFWLRDVPLGEYYLHPSEMPLRSAQVARLAANAVAETVRHRLAHDACVPFEDPVDTPPVLDRPLATLGSRLPRPADAADLAQRTTVVVATRDRPGPLAQCLSSLLALDPAPAGLLVVDNSRHASAAEIATDVPGTTWIHEPQPGLSRARNAALDATTSEFVAFTDDDVTVPSGWLGQLVAPFRDDQVGSTTGLVLAAALRTNAQLHFERRLRYLHKGYRPVEYGRTFLERSRQRREVPPVWRIGAGASFALRRRSMETVGRFDERLGAGAAGCSEDSEWWYRALHAGWLCRYEPAAVVRHHHRTEERELVDQTRAYLRGHVVALGVQHLQDPTAHNLRRIAVSLPKDIASQVPVDLIGGRLRRRLLRARMRGFAEGALLVTSLLRSARQRR